LSALTVTICAIAGKMTVAQITEAQRRARYWRPEPPAS
jgi:hypothetical protein